MSTQQSGNFTAPPSVIEKDGYPWPFQICPLKGPHYSTSVSIRAVDSIVIFLEVQIL